MVSVNPIIEQLAPDWLAGLRGGRRLRSVRVQPDGTDLALISDWIAAGKVWPLIERSLPLAAAAAAHKLSATWRMRGKLVLEVDPELAAQTTTVLAQSGIGERQNAPDQPAPPAVQV